MPRTSWEPVAVLDHLPTCIWDEARKSFRCSAIVSPMVFSATERVLLNGALKTVTPLAAAPGRSTWFVPMQKQPTAQSLCC